MDYKHFNQKQNNKQKNNKGGKQSKQQKSSQVAAALEAQQSAKKNPLTFKDDHQAKPAQDFASKKLKQQRRGNTQSSNNLLPQGVNKVKNPVNSYMPKQNNSSTFQSITEEKSLEQIPVWPQKEQELTIISAVHGEDEVNILEHPSSDKAGEFTIRVKPLCGAQEIGCYVELSVSYLEVDSLDFTCELLQNRAFGLDDSQLWELNAEMESCLASGDTLEYLFDKISERLGDYNNFSRTVINIRNLEEEKVEAQKQEENQEKERKEAAKNYSQYCKTRREKIEEEMKWAQSLANEHRQARQRMHASSTKLNNATTTAKLQKKEQCEKEDAECTMSEKSKTEGDNTLNDIPVEKQKKLVSRYETDFEEIGKIGEGAFGMVFKARHVLDKNIYAVKKIKMPNRTQKKERERILREINFLSQLNHQHIVRYFQTWEERETNPEIIQQFEAWESDEYDSENGGSHEMITEEYSDEDMMRRRRQVTNQRSSSFDKGSSNFPKRQHPNHQNSPNKQKQPILKSLVSALSGTFTGDDVNEAEADQRFFKPRAKTEHFNWTSDQKKSSVRKIAQEAPFKQQTLVSEDDEGWEYYDEEDDEEEQLVMQNYQDSEYNALEEASEYNRSEMSPGQYLKQSVVESDIMSMTRRDSHENEDGIIILYIQMQFCDGQTLEQFLKTNTYRTNEELKWKIFRQVLEAVTYLHQNEIIHRDIKPENIFLDSNYNARLGDFGLARRIDKNNKALQKQDLEAEAEQDTATDAETTDQNIEMVCKRQMTTGVGTLRFAAPEQLSGRKNCYGFKADIYSLGVVLLDMFRDINAFHKVLNDIHTSMLSGKVLPELAVKMPRDAVTLIEDMVQKEPEKRPSLLTVLFHEALPQDDVLKNLLPHLQNHKSAVKLQLMRHLTSLNLPKAVDVQYNGILRVKLDNLKANQKANQMRKRAKIFGREEKLIENILERKKRHENVETKVLGDLRELFEQNGARNLHNLQTINPIIPERTIFLSKAIRLEPWLKKLAVNCDKIINEKIGLDRTESATSQNWAEVRKAFNEATENDHSFNKQKLLREDYLLMCEGQHDEEEKQRDTQSSSVIVKPYFDCKIPQQDSCWQQLCLRVPDLIKPKHACKLVDEKGIVVCLQTELIEAIAKRIVNQRPELVQKVYHVGQTFSDSACAAKNKYEKIELAPTSTTKACYAFVNPAIKQRRNEFIAPAKVSTEELMFEVDLLRLTEEAFRSSEIANYELRVSSSELLDAIFEECKISLVDRVKLLQLIDKSTLLTTQPVSTSQSKRTLVGIGGKSQQLAANEAKKQTAKELKIQEINEILSKYDDADQLKFKSLMKIKGSTKQILNRLAHTPNISLKSIFAKMIDYFKELEEKLKLFGVLSSQNHDSDEESKDHESKATRKSHERVASISTSRSRNNGQAGSGKAPAKATLVFDFGLVLQQSLTHYSGLLCSVTVQSNKAEQVRTLAYGGRFDNSISQSQLHLQQQAPAAVGITFNCAELADHIIDLEIEDKKTKKRNHLIDFCVGSEGPKGSQLLGEKIKVMQALKAEGWRVHIDYSDNMYSMHTRKFCRENNVRFLIQVEEEKIFFTDRFGYLDEPNNTASATQLQANEVQTKYADVRQLLSDFRKKKEEKNTAESNGKLC